MPILRLNAKPDGLVLHGSPAPALATVRTAASGTGPVVIMIHGYKYDPDCPDFCPHTTIFARETSPPRPGHMSWVKHLGFGTGNRDEGLAIAFGWRARGNLWRAQRSAIAAGQHLARVVTVLRARAPDRPIHVVTHSMGSEVVFEALHRLPAHSLHRIVTLTGASYASRARAAMQSDAGRSAELINVTSRENDLFDFMFERLTVPPRRGDRAIGVGLDLPNAVTLQLDCARSLKVLGLYSAPIIAAQRRVCHWSCYTRPGALRFYARALRQPHAVPLAALQQVLPEAPAPRWSRMFAVSRVHLPLPAASKPAS